MAKRHLNLSRRTWLQLRRNWSLKPTPMLLWQSLVTGPLLSGVNRLQLAATRKDRDACSLTGSIFVIGYWRSGTTLLHELLSLDTRYSYPSTHACMNPHHFMLTEAEMRRQAGAAVRPMDNIVVRADSPQEEEFGLLGWGVRSPYEALLVPSRFREALRLADPDRLSAGERAHWRASLIAFLGGVSLVGGHKPVIAKSPLHGYRIADIQALVPEARFILVVRDPCKVFESATRMWSRMMDLYALEALPSDDMLRAGLLEDRQHFERKLAQDTATLPESRLATLRYEDLVHDPVAALEGVYARLELGGFEAVRPAIVENWRGRAGFVAGNADPPQAWKERLAQEWSGIFAQYGYPAP